MFSRLLPFIIGSFLIIPLFFQASSQHVSANHESTMTSPITFFNVVGKVTYKQLGRFFSSAQRSVGADDIVVTATGFFDKTKKYTTTTDPNGVYSFNIPVGLYTIKVTDPSKKTSFFVPPLNVENLNTHKAAKVNFQGLIFR